MPSQEILGFRCSEISQRHRLYGPDVPACDLDFMLVEYDHAQPIALFEYKFNRGPRIDMDQASIKAFASLGSLAALPSFVAQYNVSTWMYRVYPANEEAKRFVARTRSLTEREFVKLLHELRGRAASHDLLATLNGDPFDDEDEPLVAESAVAEDCVPAAQSASQDEWDWDWDEDDLAVASVG